MPPRCSLFAISLFQSDFQPFFLSLSLSFRYRNEHWTEAVCFYKRSESMMERPGEWIENEKEKIPYPRDPVLFTPFYRLRSTRVTKIRFLLKKNDWWDQWADDCWRLRTSLIWDDAAIENWVACVKMTLLYKVMLNSKNISSVGTEKPSLSTLKVSF